MKKIFLLVLLFYFQVSFSQDEPTETVSLDFNNLALIEVLEQLEKKTSHTFFFIEDWLQDIKVSGTYNNTPITKVLEDVFQNTVLNYFLLDGEKIILTRNNIIYDELPAGFFDHTDTDTAETEEVPVSEPIIRAQTPSSADIETVYIGREIKNSSRRNFTLSGIVIDAETNRPLSGVSIMVRERNMGTTTNEDGYYEINLPAGSYLLETSSMETKELKKGW